MEDRLMVSVSGVRGVVGGSLTPQVAREFGLAFGTMLKAGKTVVIGRDTRPSGPALQQAVTEGLCDAGVSVVDLGMASTPAIAFMTRQLSAHGGVVITASHNPEPYNGIKFLQRIGTGLTARDAARLGKIWKSKRFKTVPQESRGQVSHDDGAAAGHVDAVVANCDLAAIAEGRFKVVLDSVNGAGSVETPMLLRRLYCDMVHLHGEPTGRFAHPPEPVEENLSELCRAVRAEGASAGFAQDADADRLAIVDENGTFLGEEYTLALAAAFVLTKRKGPLATNLVTSRMVDDVAAAEDCEVIRAPTGEANVVEALRANRCIFGGEGGGGVIEPRVVPVRNSLIGIAYVLQYMAETKLALSDLVAMIPRYVMIKTKIPCATGAAEKVAAAVRQAFEGREGASFNDADGLRVDLPDGWVCARASNTEPILRIIAEAPEAETAEALIEEVRKIAEPLAG